MAAAPPRRTWRVPIAATVGLLAGAALASLAGRTGPRPEPAPSPLRRFELRRPRRPRSGRAGKGGTSRSRRMPRASCTRRNGGASRARRPRFDRLDTRFVAGSEDGLDPFLSPDGTQIGFTTYTELKRVPAAGGPAETICPVETYFSGATLAGRASTIVYTQGLPWPVPRRGDRRQTLSGLRFQTSRRARGVMSGRRRCPTGKRCPTR